MSSKTLENFKLINMDSTNIFNPTDVWISIFKADRSFYIKGTMIEGHILNDLVLESDKLCIRYNWDFQDSVDVEVYGNGRQGWYRLSIPQFHAIRNYIAEIQ